MSSLVQRVDDLAKRCADVGWEVFRGRKHVQVRVPGQARPIALPGSPSSARAITNLEVKFRKLGLDDAYAEQLAARRQEARNKVATGRNRANTKIAAIEEGAKQPLAAALAENGMKLSFERIGPKEAIELLKVTAEATDFKQRPLSQVKVQQYVEEMKYGEWKEFMPDGVICIDPKGLLLNGQKRMHAVIESDKTIGFVVARDVPRELFAYFDMAQPRSASDTFASAGLPYGPDVQSAVRLAMSYESMLRGTLDRVSWPSWNKVRATNPDALAFYKRRPELGDLLQPAKALTYQAKIVCASAMVFEFYANKAWPNRGTDEKGFDPLESFLVGIRDGEHLRRVDPAYLVRDWSMSNAADRTAVPAKRETYLFMLMRYWNQHCKGERQQNQRVFYQRSWPMPLPYHPDGEDAAVSNALR